MTKQTTFHWFNVLGWEHGCNTYSRGVNSEI